MPIGEDIPMLIPIAIILSVLILFMLGIFINMSEQNEVVRMSQVSMDTIAYASNILFADGFGNLDYSKMNGLGNKSECDRLDELNITVSYRIKINVSDISTSDWWCWTNSLSESAETSITNSAPFAIINSNQTDMGRVAVSVSK